MKFGDNYTSRDSSKCFVVTESAEDRLERILMEASMENRTVIITVLIYPWAAPNSLLDLFMKSFRTGICTWGLLRHLVIVALDQRAFTRCLLVHTHCFALATEGVDFSEEAYFMGPEYLKMMWTRIVFLRHVLELGYNFVFTLLFSAKFLFLDQKILISCGSGTLFNISLMKISRLLVIVTVATQAIEFTMHQTVALHFDTIPSLNLCFTPPIAEADSLAAFVVTLLPQGLAGAVCFVQNIDEGLETLQVSAYELDKLSFLDGSSVPAGSPKKGKRGHKETISPVHGY
ncbi:hypothetical protein LguiA_000783 [Lonicera macranthoides]